MTENTSVQLTNWLSTTDSHECVPVARDTRDRGRLNAMKRMVDKSLKQNIPSCYINIQLSYLTLSVIILLNNENIGWATVSISSGRWRWWVTNSQFPVLGSRLLVWPSTKACHFSKQFIVNVKNVEFATNHTL